MRQEVPLQDVHVLCICLTKTTEKQLNLSQIYHILCSHGIPSWVAIRHSPSPEWALVLMVVLVETISPIYAQAKLALSTDKLGTLFAPKKFAMGTKLNTVAIQTILRGVDIQRDTKGMITETCAVAMIIDIAAGHADPIADHGVYRHTGLDKLM